SVLRVPPAAPRFPYTTLFRSRPAPTLLPEEAVRRMRAGSVIVDLAAEAGGNCTLTRAGETVRAHGVTILGPLNLPSTLPLHASQDRKSTRLNSSHVKISYAVF